MATFGSLQTRVQTRVIDLPTAVLTEVPDLINDAMRRIQERHNFKVMETLLGPSLTTAASTVLVAVPANFKELRNHPYEIRNTGSVHKLITAANRTEALAEYHNDPAKDIGAPQVLIEGEPSDDAGTRNFEVYPFPDGASDYSDGEYRVFIPYWRYVTALSSAADTNWFTVNAELYLLADATAAAFMLDWDEERSLFWTDKANKRFNDTLNLDKRFRLAGVDTMVIHKGVHGPKLRF